MSDALLSDLEKGLRRDARRRRRQEPHASAARIAKLTVDTHWHLVAVRVRAPSLRAALERYLDRGDADLE